MGDAGSNLLGLLLGCTAVLGAVKTQAALALVFPFLILAVPVARHGIRGPQAAQVPPTVYHADREHFHHRLDRIGYSTRRAVLVLYGWTIAMASVAVVSRFVQPFASDGSLRTANAVILGSLFLLALAASVFVVYVLEILKFERDGRRGARADGRAGAPPAGEPVVVAGAPPTDAPEVEADDAPPAPTDAGRGAPGAERPRLDQTGERPNTARSQMSTRASNVLASSRRCADRGRRARTARS